MVCCEEAEILSVRTLQQSIISNGIVEGTQNTIGIESVLHLNEF